MTEAEAEAAVRTAISERKRCFLSTPNLNFAVACLSDSSFRNSVLQSDVSLADGWPVVACAHLSRTRLPQRVAGSSLFDRLCRSAHRPELSVYFFGGPDGAAAKACSQLNQAKQGTRCVGFDAPGFASVEEMSTVEQINRINQAQPDFLILALGAKKGQAWIQHNLTRLEVPVVSHLGAVVNFVAGSIRRAPKWMQAIGLEWMWRVKEEPALWKRYANDGTALITVLLPRVLSSAMDRLKNPPSTADFINSNVSRHFSSVGTELTLKGPWALENIDRLRSEFAQHAALQTELTINLAHATHLDSCAIGQLMLLYGWQLKIGKSWKISHSSSAARRALRLASAEYLLD
jgi:N-acetylglucosaminyldiphosphoundecaprenol N-acetyl-beta-D-mannosaminyltransferase